MIHRQYSNKIAPSASGSINWRANRSRRAALPSRDRSIHKRKVQFISDAVELAYRLPARTRHAPVAINRARVTPLFHLVSANSEGAAVARVIAGSLMPPSRDALAQRTMRENASTTRKPSPAGRATKNRQLFVPRSSVAYVHRPGRGRSRDPDVQATADPTWTAEAAPG